MRKFIEDMATQIASTFAIHTNPTHIQKLQKSLQCQPYQYKLKHYPAQKLN
jgi:hypothetical protein